MSLRGSAALAIGCNLRLQGAYRAAGNRKIIINGSEKKKFSVTVDRDEDGIWIAECPVIPGCISQGATKDEALSNSEEAIALCLEVRAENGMPLTVETRQVAVVADGFTADFIAAT